MMRSVVAIFAIAFGTQAGSSVDVRPTQSMEAEDTTACLLQVGLKVEDSELDHSVPPIPISQPRANGESADSMLSVPGGSIAPPVLLSVKHLFQGYNAFYGNPFSTSETDEGFVKNAGKPIFETRYQRREVIGDGQELVPDGLRFSPVRSSGSCAEISVISGAGPRAQLDAMNAFVAEAEGGREPGWFTASTDFRSFEDMERRGLRRVVVISQCVALNVSIDVFGEDLQLSAAFLERARSLPDNYKASDYFSFFDEFGTHVLSAASLGALTGISAFLDEAQYLQLKVKEGGLGSKGALENLMSDGKVGSRFIQRGEEALDPMGTAGAAMELSLGSKWSQAASLAPETVSLRLKSICGILGRADVAVPAIRVSHCERAARAQEYCMRHVMPREGLNPWTCVHEDSAGAGSECVWDSDCDSHSTCEGRSCKHHNALAMAFNLMRQNGQDTPDDSMSMAPPLTQFKSKSFSYLLNLLLVIPWGLMGIPLGIIWYQLKSLKDEKDTIWTAEEESMRIVEISSIGISGVALLRRPSDRRWAIRCTFLSFIFQMAFLYFIIVYDFASLNTEFVIFVRTPALLFCSLFLNALSCCSIMICGAKTWQTEAPEGYETIHIILVSLDAFIIPSVCIIAGTLFLCTSIGITSLIFSSTSMGFVVNFNRQFAALLSWSLANHGGRAFRPTEVFIKDDVDSMTYAMRSLIFSFAVATVTVLVGMIWVGTIKAA